MTTVSQNNCRWHLLGRNTILQIATISFITTTIINAFSPHIYINHERHSNILHPIRRRQQQQQHRQTSIVRLQSSTNSNSNNDDIESLKKQAEKIRLEAEQMEALLTLEKINNLESRLKKLTTSSSTTTKSADRDAIRNDVLQLWQKVDPNGANQAIRSFSSSKADTTDGNILTDSSNGGNGLSPAALKTATDAFLLLSPSIQIALAKAVEMEMEMTNETNNIDAIVNRLYVERDNLTAEQLQREYRSSILFTRMPSSSSSSSVTSSKDNTETTDDDDDDELLQFPSLPAMDSPEAKRIRFVESALPQLVTRPDDASLTPTLDDAQLFLNDVLLPTLTKYRSSSSDDDKVLFNPTAPPEEIPGGFIFRGTILNDNNNDEENKNYAAMISLLDAAMTAHPTLSTKYQHYLIKDPTPEALEDADSIFGQPVIFLSTSQLQPTTSRSILSIVTLSSLFLVALFSVGTFAGNDAVVERFRSDNALGVYDADWFNSLLAPLVGGVLGVQAMHEVGHVVAAKGYDVTLTPPTLLPSVFGVPHLGCVTSIKTSPKDYTVLYDVAMAGPLLGMVGSVVCLVGGLYLTVREGNLEYVKYFPSLGGDVIGSSRLGAAIVDGVLGYGDMMGGMTTRGAEESVALHPLAVAGFVSLYVNALNLLPLGNTDGGRIAQTLFNRTGHTVVQGLTYLVLFGVSLFGGDRTNIFLAYTLFCLFAQNDLEIPCRDEVTVVDFGRSALAIGMWLLAVLVLVPV